MEISTNLKFSINFKPKWDSYLMCWVGISKPELIRFQCLHAVHSTLIQRRWSHIEELELWSWRDHCYLHQIRCTWHKSVFECVLCVRACKGVSLYFMSTWGVWWKWSRICSFSRCYASQTEQVPYFFSSLTFSHMFTFCFLHPSTLWSLNHLEAKWLVRCRETNACGQSFQKISLCSLTYCSFCLLGGEFLPIFFPVWFGLWGQSLQRKTQRWPTRTGLYLLHGPHYEIVRLTVLCYPDSSATFTPCVYNFQYWLKKTRQSALFFHYSYIKMVLFCDSCEISGLQLWVGKKSGYHWANGR